VRGHSQRSDSNTKSLFSSGGSETPHLTLGGDALKVRKTIEKKFRYIPAVDGRCSPLQQLLSRSIHERDTSFNIRGDQTAANRVNDILMQSLKTEQFAAFVLQLHAGLAKLGRQSAGKMRNGEVGEQIDENDRQKRLGIRTRR